MHYQSSSTFKNFHGMLSEPFKSSGKKQVAFFLVSILISSDHFEYTMFSFINFQSTNSIWQFNYKLPCKKKNSNSLSYERSPKRYFLNSVMLKLTLHPEQPRSVTAHGHVGQPRRLPAAALRTRDPQRSIKTHSAWRERFELSEFS